MCILLTKICQYCRTRYFENWKECPFMHTNSEECHEHRRKHETALETVTIDCGCITLHNQRITLFARSQPYSMPIKRRLYGDSDDGDADAYTETHDFEKGSVKSVESDGERWREVIIEEFTQLGWVKTPEDFTRETDWNSSNEYASGRRMLLPLSALSDAATQTDPDEEDPGRWEEDGCGSCVFSALS